MNIVPLTPALSRERRGRTAVVLIVFFLASLGFFVSLGSLAKESNQKELTILYTNNNNGNLKHCGCPGNPQGGLAQRYAAIEEIRRKGGSILLLDGGDLFPARIDDDYKLSYFLNIIERFRYDAIVLGDQDFGKGYRETVNFIASKRIPYLAVNLLDAKSGEPLVPGFLRKTIGGQNILIIGVVSPTAFIFFPDEMKGQIVIEDPVKQIKKVLQKERQPGDVVIILSHMGLEEDRALVKAVSGIQVIVGGHSQNKLDQPLREGGALIVQAGKNQEYLGVLTIRTTEGRVDSFKNRLVSINDSIQENPEIGKMVHEYESTLTQVNVWSGDLAKPFEASRCQTCHQAAFEIWAKSRHAHALESIHHDTRAKTKECLLCHTTVIHDSFMRDGKAIPMKVVGDIQCQVCHQMTFPGGSSMHQLLGSESKPTRATAKDFCLKCHTVKDSPQFDFESYWGKIKHGK